MIRISRTRRVLHLAAAVLFGLASHGEAFGLHRPCPHHEGGVAGHLHGAGVSEERDDATHAGYAPERDGATRAGHASHADDVGNVPGYTREPGDDATHVPHGVGSASATAGGPSTGADGVDAAGGERADTEPGQGPCTCLGSCTTAAATRALDVSGPEIFLVAPAARRAAILEYETVADAGIREHRLPFPNAPPLR